MNYTKVNAFSALRALSPAAIEGYSFGLIYKSFKNVKK